MHYLNDAKTGEVIREATADEIAASDAVDKVDPDGAGIFLVGDRQVYTEKQVHPGVTVTEVSMGTVPRPTEMLPASSIIGPALVPDRDYSRRMEQFDLATAFLDRLENLGKMPIVEKAVCRAADLIRRLGDPRPVPTDRTPYELTPTGRAFIEKHREATNRLLEAL